MVKLRRFRWPGRQKSSKASLFLASADRALQKELEEIHEKPDVEEQALSPKSSSKATVRTDRTDLDQSHDASTLATESSPARESAADHIRSNPTTTPTRTPQRFFPKTSPSDDSSLTSRRTTESAQTTRDLVVQPRAPQHLQAIGASINQGLEIILDSESWAKCSGAKPGNVENYDTFWSGEKQALERTESVWSGASTEIATNRALDISRKRIDELEQQTDSLALAYKVERELKEAEATPTPTRHAAPSPAQVQRLGAQSILSESSADDTLSRDRASATSPFLAATVPLERTSRLGQHVERQQPGGRAKETYTGPVDCDISFQSQSLSSSVGVEFDNRNQSNAVVKDVLETRAVTIDRSAVQSTLREKLQASSRPEKPNLVNQVASRTKRSLLLPELRQLKPPPPPPPQGFQTRTYSLKEGSRKRQLVSPPGHDTEPVGTPPRAARQAFEQYSPDPVFCAKSSVASNMLSPGASTLPSFPSPNSDFAAVSLATASLGENSVASSMENLICTPSTHGPDSFVEAVDDGSKTEVSHGSSSKRARHHEPVPMQKPLQTTSLQDKPTANRSSYRVPPFSKPAVCNSSTDRMVPLKEPNVSTRPVRKTPKVAAAFLAAVAKSDHRGRPTVPEAIESSEVGVNDDAVDDRSIDVKSVRSALERMIQSPSTTGIASPCDEVDDKSDDNASVKSLREAFENVHVDSERQPEKGIDRMKSVFEPKKSGARKSLNESGNGNVRQAFAVFEKSTGEKIRRSHVVKSRIVMSPVAKSIAPSVQEGQKKADEPAAPDPSQLSVADRIRAFGGSRPVARRVNESTGHSERLDEDRRTDSATRDSESFKDRLRQFSGEKKAAENAKHEKDSAFRARVNQFSPPALVANRRPLSQGRPIAITENRAGAVAPNEKQIVLEGAETGVPEPEQRRNSLKEQRADVANQVLIRPVALKPVVRGPAVVHAPRQTLLKPLSTPADQLQGFISHRSESGGLVQQPQKPSSLSRELPDGEPKLQSPEMKSPTTTVVAEIRSKLTEGLSGGDEQGPVAVKQVEQKASKTVGGHEGVVDVDNKANRSLTCVDVKFSDEGNKDTDESGVQASTRSVEEGSEFSDGVTLDMSIAEVSNLTTPTALISKTGDTIGEGSDAHVSTSMEREDNTAPSRSTKAVDGSDVSPSKDGDLIEQEAKRSEASSSQTSEAAAPLIARALRMGQLSDDASFGDSFFASRLRSAKQKDSSTGWNSSGSMMMTHAVNTIPEATQVSSPVQVSGSRSSDNAWDASQVESLFPKNTNGSQDLFDFDSGWETFRGKEFFGSEEMQGTETTKSDVSHGSSKSRAKTPTRSNRGPAVSGHGQSYSEGIRTRPDYQSASVTHKRPLPSSAQPYGMHGSAPLLDSRAYQPRSRAGHEPHDADSFEFSLVSPPSRHEVFSREVHSQALDQPFLGSAGLYTTEDDEAHTEAVRHSLSVFSRTHPRRSDPTWKRRAGHLPSRILNPSDEEVLFSYDTDRTSLPTWSGTPRDHGPSTTRVDSSFLSRYKSQHAALLMRLKRMKEARLRRAESTYMSSRAPYERPESSLLSNRDSEADEYSHSTMSSTKFGGSVFLAALEVD